MERIKETIAKNITLLRQNRKMTQIDLAEHLNYSDKAVSKWERGESVPDVSVLMQIADLFGVSLDRLVRGDCSVPLQQQEPPAPADRAEDTKRQKRNRRTAITLMSILLVWFVATVVFVMIELIAREPHGHWLAFVYAVPLSMIVWLVFNSIWFNRRRNYLIISFLVWSLLAAVFFNLLFAGVNGWLLFVLGIPGQICIILWSRLNVKQKS